MFVGALVVVLYLLFAIPATRYNLLKALLKWRGWAYNPRSALSRIYLGERRFFVLFDLCVCVGAGVNKRICRAPRHSLHNFLVISRAIDMFHLFTNLLYTIVLLLCLLGFVELC
jgi:hypothetical protein